MQRNWLSWKTVWAAVATSLVAAACSVSGAPHIVSIASLVGIAYVVLVAYGHWTANVFGAVLGGLFGYLSYQAGFFGNAAVNILATVPLSLWGVWYWKRHQGEKPRRMNRFQALHGAGIFLFFALGSMWFSFSHGSNLWYLDGLTAIMPIFATILLVTRYREQWYLWIAFNFLEIIMWLHVVSSNTELLAILVMRVVFFFNSLIGAYLWFKPTGGEGEKD